ncbi:MAG: single-stranded DNA-binding protein [Tetragenococcus halophilus]|nr:single-stranded DNA-binding protein [Tetragenococcus halophilus]
MINNVVLTGRLTAEPELKYTGSGTAVISFNLAVDRTFKNAQGERETDFVNCVAWRKTAELIANNLRKGSLFGVVGRIQTRNYTNNDGKKVYVTEVVCESVQFLESKNSNQHSDNNQNNRKSPDFDEDPFDRNNDPVQIDDSDLPF